MACISCKAFLWFYWLFLAFVTGTYAALSLASFSNIYRAYDDGEEDNEAFRAILAATIFGSVLVVLFAIFSFLILLGKTITATSAGTGYGLLLSSTFHMAITSLLCALVMHGFEDDVEERLEKVEDIDWEGVETNTYQATWAFAYIATAVYAFFFVWLFLGQWAFTRKPAEPKTPAAAAGKESATSDTAHLV